MGDPAPPKIGETVAGRYKLVRVIEEGATDSVFEVEHETLGARRFLRWVHPQMTLGRTPEQIERMARRGAEIDSPHVVEVLDVVVDERTGATSVVMELLRGETLLQRVERLARLSFPEAIAVMKQVEHALARAHAKGIVHGDLVANRVFLHRDRGPEVVKLLGFGRLFPADAEGGARVLGSPVGLAPEMTNTGARPTAACDAWAFGLLAYHALVGTPYFEGDTVMAVLRAILMEPLVSPVERAARHGVTFPNAFDDWFFRLVARDPSERGTVSDQVAALERALEVIANDPPIEPPILPGNPKGSFYDSGLARGDLTPPDGVAAPEVEVPRDVEILQGNPKGSRYDDGLQETGRVWPFLIVLIVAMIVAGVVIVAFRS